MKKGKLNKDEPLVCLVERGVSPRRCLAYILNNWELYAEWCQEGRNPIDFLMTMPGRITEKDIEWAQKSLEQKAG